MHRSGGLILISKHGVILGQTRNLGPEQGVTLTIDYFLALFFEM